MTSCFSLASLAARMASPFVSFEGNKPFAYCFVGCMCFEFSSGNYLKHGVTHFLDAAFCNVVKLFFFFQPNVLENVSNPYLRNIILVTQYCIEYFICG